MLLPEVLILNFFTLSTVRRVTLLQHLYAVARFVRGGQRNYAMPRTEQTTGEELLPDPLVAKRYHVSTRTLPRWDENPALGFPPPIRINNRKYRRLRDLERWERERAAPEPNRGLQNRLKPAQERSDSSHKAGQPK